MTTRLPHDPYMDLVHAELSDLGIWPIGFRTDDPDGQELDATFEFRDEAVSEDEWPDGVYLSWTSSDGWALTDTGSSRTAYPLDLDPYAAPAAVATRAHARLAGTPDPAVGSTDWDLKEPIATSVNEWMDQRERV
ncbi:hypothetical protein [Streptomyces griseus]|uniref:hypothetical protein n=1 Tax=Streptomyces griseus TaxID=1911 RepID=UPI00379FECD5